MANRVCIKTVTSLAALGLTKTEIAAEMGLGRGSLSRVVKREGIQVQSKRRARKDPRISRVLDLIYLGYGREDIGIKIGCKSFVNRLFDDMRQNGQLDRLYARSAHGV